MYVTLALAKAHCNVSTEISDSLLQFYIDTAEQRAADYLNLALATLVPEGGEGIPAPIRAAVLFWVADMVANKESIVVGTISSELQVPFQLLQPYRIGMGV